MTRKEELEQKANKAVDLVYGRVDRNADLDEYDRRECVANICAMFLQVEREVWEKVVHEANKKANSILISNEQQPFCDGFRAGAHNMALWCNAQLEELT